MFKPLTEKYFSNSNQYDNSEDKDIYIELVDLSPSQRSPPTRQLTQFTYDGKFSKEIEQKNKQKVIKYILGFIALAILVTIAVVTLIINFESSDDNEDDEQNQNIFEEVRVDDQEMQNYYNDVEEIYHQGCLQQKKQEDSCLTCIYETNMKQTWMDICDSYCCRTCLLDQIYVTQRYCVHDGKISKSDDSLLNYEQVSEKTTLQRFIQIIQQSDIWQSLKIQFTYGSIQVSQINYVKETLFYLSKVINQLLKLESLEIITGYISIKDDIFGNIFKYNHSFMYEDIIKDLQIPKLKLLVLDLSKDDSVYSDQLLYAFSETIRQSQELQNISLLINKNTRSLPNFTHETFNLLTQAIKNQKNLQILNLSLPVLQTQIQLDVSKTLESISPINFQQLDFSEKFTNLDFSKLAMQKISQLQNLNYLNLNIYPISVSSIAEGLKNLKYLKYLKITFTELSTLDSILFQALQNDNNLKEFHIQLKNSNEKLILDDQVLIDISKMIGQSNKLSIISIEFDCQDTFTDQGLEEFLQSIQLRKSELISFYFSVKNQLFSDVGLKLFSKYFADNEILESFSLDIRENQNFNKESFTTLCECLKNLKTLTSIKINIKSSHQINGQDEEYNTSIINSLTSPPLLSTLHITISETSKKQITNLLYRVSQSNIIDIVLKASKLYEQLQSIEITSNNQQNHVQISNYDKIIHQHQSKKDILLNNIEQKVFLDNQQQQVNNLKSIQKLNNNLISSQTDDQESNQMKEIKYLQNFINIHLEVEDLSTYIMEEEICSFIIKPFTQQKHLKHYKMQIGCEKTLTQLRYYLNILVNIENVELKINKDEYLNITESQFNSLLNTQRIFSNINYFYVDLTNQKNITESSIINIHDRLSQTISQYTLILPEDIEFSPNFFRHISHFNALLYCITNYRLEIPKATYNSTNMEILLHSVLISSNQNYNDINISLPCQLQIDEIVSLGKICQHFIIYYIQFNNCTFELEQFQQQLLEDSFQSTQLSYVQNTLIIKKSQYNN